MTRSRSGIVAAIALAACGGSAGPPSPSISGVAPDGGPPGTQVTVSGSGLTDASEVTFGGIPAWFSVVGDREIGTMVPEGAVSGPIRVTTPGGTAESPVSFTVPPPFWTSRPAATSDSLLGITWAGGQLVAVGGNGAIVTSPDAEAWTARFSSTSQPLFGVAGSGSRYVAVGGVGALTVLTSTDGASWTFPCLTDAQCNPPGGTPPVGCGGDPTGGFHAVLWSGTQFVAVGKFLSGAILTSPDGSAGSWVPRSGPNLGVSTCSCPTCDPTKPMWAVSASPDRYVAAGEGGPYGYWSTSPDGASWSMISVSPSTITGLAWSGDRFVAVGYGGVAFVSADGLNWQARPTGTTADLFGVAWAGDRFVAVGKAGATLSSPDGVDWTVEYSGTLADINAVTWTGELLVAVGYQGMVLTAP